VIALRFQSLSIRNVRNLAQVDVQLVPRLNVLFGDNGHGKTSFLEAIYLVCTTKSFRTGKLGEIVTHARDVASVRADVHEGEERREQVVGLQGGKRHVTLSGKRPTTLADYAVRSPVVVFHPGEMVLSYGPPSARRTLLDRVALFIDKASMDHGQRYAGAMRARQRTLEMRGTASAELTAFERLMAVHGAALTAARREASERIAEKLQKVFERITSGQRRLQAQYEPGGSTDPEREADILSRSRERDRQKRAASAGPHRDELKITMNGYDARVDASQGEHRAITMALKISELQCVSEARGTCPILLLDDVSSELDQSRTALLFDFLRDVDAQVVLTTTQPALIEKARFEASERAEFHVRDGVFEAGRGARVSGGNN
jgi:DNA replication and repair protein RecF